MTLNVLASNAGAAVYKTGKFLSAHRYMICLEIDEVVFTELHLHARTARGARKHAQYMADNASRILSETGMMGTAFQRIIAHKTGRPELPASTDTVFLTNDIGKAPAGTPAFVLWSEWDDEVENLENQYPVTVSLTDSDGEEHQVPLALDDFTMTRPLHGLPVRGAGK